MDSSPPLHRLFERTPIELLQGFFLHCLPPSPSVAMGYPYHYLGECSPRIAPLLLCQICRTWRQAAISFPNLWTSLDVVVLDGKARPSAPLVATWLARSGALPLSLSLCQFHQSDSLEDNCIAGGEIFELYKQYISRWYNIHFDLMGPRYTFPIAQRSAPMLNSFSMESSYSFFPDVFGIFDFVPCLSNLHVPAIPNLNHLGDCSMQIPWFQLASLSLNYIPSICASLHILEKCPNLTDASFKIDLHDTLPLNHLVHHKLRSLTINIRQDHLSLFLGHVTFPALIQATINLRQTYEWPQGKLEEFLERSQCKLVQLEIHHKGMNYTAFTACVRNRHLQSLVRFLVHDTRDCKGPFITKQAIGLLTCSSCDNINMSKRRGITRVGDSGCFLPNLESISIRGTPLWTDDGMVASMVESRWRFHHCKRLKNLAIEVPASHVEDIRRLQELRREGLELDLYIDLMACCPRAQSE